MSNLLLRLKTWTVAKELENNGLRWLIKFKSFFKVHPVSVSVYSDVSGPHIVAAKTKRIHY